jgi:aspartyl-tRNA(Asn)/glutamyl-tRNA(Gln) amidotransferase subunit A
MSDKEMTISETLAAYRAKTLKPSDVCAAFFARIKADDVEIHAYLRTYENEAMAQALKADEAYAAGSARPLEGIFIGVKDNLLIAGTETTSASKMLEGYVATYTGTAVGKLLAAGAIMLGKTNMDEFAMGSSTENSAYGPTKNPRDTDCVPGGSSGGSAAAVAAGLCHAALGSDTGGSIRQPASLCGCVGFKPTYGSVSRYGLMAMASSLDVIGPLANSVADARVIYGTISGADKKDATSHDIKGDKKLAQPGSLKGVKVGVPKEYFLPGMDAGVEGQIQKGIAKLKELGAEIVDISLPNAECGLATYYVIMPAEVSTNLSRFDGVRYAASQMKGASSLVEGYVRSRSAFGPEPQRRILVGTYVLSAGYYDAYYRQAEKARGLLVKDFNEAWRQVDVIVSPTSPTVAWGIGEKVSDPLSMYLSDVFTINANLVGIPSISVPCGESDGMPVGLQLAAPRDEDMFLLDVAEAFESAGVN